MNLPVGDILEEGLPLKDFKPRQTLELLSDKLFSGYVVCGSEGIDGMEEGVLLFKKGEVIAAIYEYCKHRQDSFGNDALPQVMNSFLAPCGIVDIISLGLSRVDLVTAFNDKITLSKTIPKKDIPKYLPKSYTRNFAEKELKGLAKEEKSSYDILKRLGLGQLSK